MRDSVGALVHAIWSLINAPRRPDATAYGTDYFQTRVLIFETKSTSSPGLPKPAFGPRGRNPTSASAILRPPPSNSQSHFGGSFALIIYVEQGPVALSPIETRAAAVSPKFDRKQQLFTGGFVTENTSHEKQSSCAFY